MLRIDLVGTCNQCGLCCAPERNGEKWRCGYLMGKDIGQPNATSCSRYTERYDGMPIELLGPNGKVMAGTCRKDSVSETVAIVENGVGKGCSLIPIVRRSDGSAS